MDIRTKLHRLQSLSF